MKEKVLIIRSVSFQQLDKNIMEIQKQFPNCEFELLTHSHGVKRSRRYPEISRIIDYESKKNFSGYHCPLELKKADYKAVVVPVTNIQGVGFLNVLFLATRIQAKKIYICNLVSEIWQLRLGKIYLKMILASIFSVLAMGSTILSLGILPLVGWVRKRLFL